MSALWWRSHAVGLGTLPGVPALRFVRFNTLKDLGFTNVRNNGIDVAGAKGSLWLSIAHFPITDRRVWEVVMASADREDEAEAQVDEVIQKLEQGGF